MTIRLDFSGNPFPDFGTKTSVGFIVIGRMPSLIPIRIPKRKTIAKDAGR